MIAFCWDERNDKKDIVSGRFIRESYPDILVFRRVYREFRQQTCCRLFRSLCILELIFWIKSLRAQYTFRLWRYIAEKASPFWGGCSDKRLSSIIGFGHDSSELGSISQKNLIDNELTQIKALFFSSSPPLSRTTQLSDSLTLITRPFDISPARTINQQCLPTEMRKKHVFGCSSHSLIRSASNSYPFHNYFHH